MASNAATTRKSLNVLMVGTEGCGKTAFVHRFATGDFLAEGPRPSPSFHRVKLELQLESGAKGELFLNIFESNNVAHDVCRAKYDATLLFFDVENIDSMLSVLTQLKSPDYECGPIIVCGNKVDRSFKKVRHFNKIIVGLRADGTIREYYDVSAKSCYNFDKPFLSLAKIVHGNSVKFQME